MKTTERNWSSIRDYQNTDFGQRSFFTRKEWIEQCFDWNNGGFPDIEDMDDEDREYYDWLSEMSDEELMGYISEHWEIEIRETTWLKAGNQCAYRGKVYTITRILLNVDDELDEFTSIILTDGEQTFGADFAECYGLTNETCPRCGAPLYVSDLCSYKYVCLDCDENF